MTPQEQNFKNAILADLKGGKYLEASLPVYFDYLHKEGGINENIGTYSWMERSRDALKVKLESEMILAVNRYEGQKVKDLKVRISALKMNEGNKTELIYQAKILYMKNIDLNEMEEKLKNL